MVNVQRETRYYAQSWISPSSTRAVAPPGD